jgi:hypothetical protein
MGAGARTWPENVRSWARRGDHGREVEDELTGGDGGTKNGADSFGPRGSEREGERARAGEID